MVTSILAGSLTLKILVSFLYLLYLPVVIGLVVLVVVLAASGTTLGIRLLIAKILVRIFEWGSSVEEHEPLYDDDGTKSDDEYDTLEKPQTIRRRHSSGDLRIIKRDHSEMIETKLSGHDQLKKKTTVSVLVDDSLDFIAAGMESIIEDQVTSRFSAEQLPSWNLLSRTKFSFMHISWKLTVLWVLGFIFRYFFLVPIRLCLFVAGFISMVVTTSLVGYIPHKPTRKWFYRRAMLTSMRIFSRSFSAIVRFHNRENRAAQGGICVANHTSPIDVMVLSTDNCYAMVGQRQGGLLGIIMTVLSRAESHIWFERGEASDRQAVSRKMREHVEDLTKLPIIIFPEGTCINNTGVMQFKKGSFEISATIYPIAMKYDSRLGDPFWNSSKQSYGEYLWMMMTSWAIICDVWYLPAMTRLPDEDSIAFARRVKKVIAKAGGLVDLEWDGNLKRERVSKKLIALQQKLYSERLASRTSLCEPKEEELDILKDLSESDREQLMKQIDEGDDEEAIIRKVSQYVPQVREYASSHAIAANGNDKES